MKKRILALILASLMLLASCTANVENDETDNESKTTETTPDTPIEEKTAYELEIERRNGISDELPEITFDGEDFVFYGSNMLSEFNLAEDYTGETYNDSLYERDLRIESRFGVDLKIQPELTGDVSATVKNSVGAGMDEYDLVGHACIIMGMDLHSDIFLDLRTVPYIDFSKPWWNKSVDELLTLYDRTFLAMGSLGLSALGNTMVLCYNNDMGKAYNREDILEVVLDGRWTYDKLVEVTSGIYTDVNADGQKDSSDKIGYYWDSSDLLNFQYAFGKTFVEKDDAGNIVTDRYYDEKLVSIVDKLYSGIYNSVDMYHSGAQFDGLMKGFIPGNTLCASMRLTYGSYLLDTDIDYSIIPMPKWDENQEKYLTTVDGASETQAVLKTAKNLEKVGVITEALNADTWKNVEYAYYEKVLKNRQLQDLRNVEVLDTIIENRVFDFGYIYGGWSWCTNGGGASDWMTTMIISFKSNNITSWVSARINNWTKYINTVVDYFKDYQD